MHKIVHVNSNPTTVEVEEFYFDETRPGRGYGDEFTGVSRIRTFPVPAWGDSHVLEHQALVLFLAQNTHTANVGFHMQAEDYARLEEVGYYND